MKKEPIKQQLIEANHTIWKMFHGMLIAIGGDRVLQYHLETLQNDLCDTDEEIDDQQAYADENKTGAYKSQGKDAIQVVKHLKKIKQEQVKLNKIFISFIAQRAKIIKLSQK